MLPGLVFCLGPVIIDIAYNSKGGNENDLPQTHSILSALHVLNDSIYEAFPLCKLEMGIHLSRL
jgi:hypothetical protein